MYKCPYQPIVREINESGNKTTFTEFGNCLKSDCPWWKPEERYKTGLFIPACCMRVTRENPKK